MLYVVLSFLLAFVLATVAYIQVKRRPLLELTRKIPGPKAYPILGNALDFGFNIDEYFNIVMSIAAKYPPITRVWVGNVFYIWLSDPKDLEKVLKSYVHLDKLFFFRYGIPWLGTGLLTSPGEKWKSRRKLLTPAFHFKILEEFVDVFNNNGNILLEKLSAHVNGPEFDLVPYITLYTLDVICETAMGVTIHAQRGQCLDYVEAIERLSAVLKQRGFKPWLEPDLLFNMTSHAKTQSKCLEVLHGMSKSVIKAKKEEFLERQRTKHSENKESGNGVKRRLAFLDLLLEASENGAVLSDEDIREEVDTFMFEGHDTTTSAISFTLWALAKHQDVQEKVAAELRAIFGDSDRNSTFNDLQEMKYLEQVIKETLRLYPVVNSFGRVLGEDTELGGYMIPSGCSVAFLTYLTHRNPDYFPDPEKYDPDRFLPENCVGRHPYCYLPFSAGPRNCIGQKFAFLEMKAAISKLLRTYKLSLKEPDKKLRLTVHLVLRSMDGIKIELTPRNV